MNVHTSKSNKQCGLLIFFKTVFQHLIFYLQIISFTLPPENGVYTWFEICMSFTLFPPHVYT